MSNFSLLNDSIHYYSIPHKFLGLNFGARMTVVKTGSGLVLYSPIPIDEKIKSDLDNFGEVKHIIAPNKFHHLWAGDAKALYPNAKLYGPPGLAEKRKDLEFDHIITEKISFGTDLDLIPIPGMKAMQESVLFEKNSRTLVVCDLLQNFRNPEGFLTNFYLRFIAGGIHNKPGLSLVVKMAFNDKKAARPVMEELIKKAPVVILPAHGEAVTSDGAKVLTEVYKWLLV